jgi:Flp pilus assembly protein TadD
VLAAQPNHPDALHLLGVLAFQCGQNDQALALLRRAVEVKPNYPQAYNHLGAVLSAMGRSAEAVAALRKAVTQSPGFAEAVFNLANALKANEQLDEAIATYRRVLVLEPRFAVAANELGMALELRGRPKEAITEYRRAIALDPNLAQAHFRLAMQLLLLGEMETGWKEYEWRFKLTGPSGYWQPPDPQWDGSDLTGRSILLHNEQGFGDTFQFIRYATMVARRGGKVLMVCAPEQLRLLQGMKAISQCFIPGEPLPKFEVQCPLMSLPFVFGTTLQTIPHDVPYLRAEAADVEKWQSKFNIATGRKKVGLVWAGRPSHPNDAKRSIPFATLAALREVANVTFFSLQKGDAANDARSPGSPLRMMDLTDEMTDFSETAACIENLDLVISVDTSIVHLAGAMGKPVWTLLPYLPEWRWMLDRDNSPWYPTMRLFRQQSPGDWSGVISRVAQTLENL